ncbi:hypothetical protein [Streptomyces sp. NPDC002644]
MDKTFKVGDKVKLSNGASGVVKYGPFRALYAGEACLVEVDNRMRTVPTRDMEPAPAFEVGDKVTWWDDLYTIVSDPYTDTDGPKFVVLGEDGGYGFASFKAGGLKPVPAEKSVTPLGEVPMVEMFKVGDRVEVVVVYPDGTEEVDGKVGTLTKLDVEDDDFPYQVNVDDGSSGWVHKVIKIDEPLKVGDHVEVVATVPSDWGLDTTCNGETGFLGEIDESDPALPYELRDGNGAYVAWVHKVRKV